jgi:hypothetical protein
MSTPQRFFTGLLSIIPLTAAAADTVSPAQGPVVNVGVSGIWILANISYAGMRAQNSSSTGWRIVAFIVGFPGTLISFLAVEEGGERAYGIEIARRGPPSAGG